MYSPNYWPIRLLELENQSETFFTNPDNLLRAQNQMYIRRNHVPLVVNNINKRSTKKNTICKQICKHKYIYIQGTEQDCFMCSTIVFENKNFILFLKSSFILHFHSEVLWEEVWWDEAVRGFLVCSFVVWCKLASVCGLVSVSATK